MKRNPALTAAHPLRNITMTMLRVNTCDVLKCMIDHESN